MELELTISAFIFENTDTMKCDLHRLTSKLKSPLVVRAHRFRKGIILSFLWFTLLYVLWKGNFSSLPGNVLELGSSTLNTSLNAGDIVESAKLQYKTGGTSTLKGKQKRESPSTDAQKFHNIGGVVVIVDHSDDHPIDYAYLLCKQQGHRQKGKLNKYPRNIHGKVSKITILSTLPPSLFKSQVNSDHDTTFEEIVLCSYGGTTVTKILGHGGNYLTNSLSAALNSASVGGDLVAVTYLNIELAARISRNRLELLANMLNVASQLSTLYRRDDVMGAMGLSSDSAGILYNPSLVRLDKKKFSSSVPTVAHSYRTVDKHGCMHGDILSTPYVARGYKLARSLDSGLCGLNLTSTLSDSLNVQVPSGSALTCAAATIRETSGAYRNGASLTNYQVTMKAKSEYEVYVDGQGCSTPQVREIVDAAETELLQLVRILEKLRELVGLDWFFSDGTLTGAVKLGSLLMPWDTDGDLVFGLKGNMASSIAGLANVYRVPVGTTPGLEIGSDGTCRIVPKGFPIGKVLPDCARSKNTPTFCYGRKHRMTTLQCVAAELETDLLSAGFKIEQRKTMIVLHGKTLNIDMHLYGDLVARKFSGDSKVADEILLPTVLMHLPSRHNLNSSKLIRVPRHPGSFMQIRKGPTVYRNPCPCAVSLEETIPPQNLFEGTVAENFDELHGRTLHNNGARSKKCSEHFQYLASSVDERKLLRGNEQDTVGTNSSGLYLGILESSPQICKFCIEDVKGRGAIQGIRPGQLAQFFPRLARFKNPD